MKSYVALLFSIVFHILVVLATKIIHFESTITLPKNNEDTYVDLGYQTFEEPPEIVEHKIVETKEEIPEKEDTTPDTSSTPQEMQDQSSEISGLQKETPKEIPKVVSNSNSNVTDVPYYKIKPKYPKDALLSGVEGHILLEIDIKEDGAVENIRITGGDKVSLFESEARRAVSKWKYKPFTDEQGLPIKKSHHLVKVEFKLNDETTIQ